jgi:hypothetical protein
VGVKQVNFEEAKPLCGGTIYNGTNWFTKSSGEWDAHHLKTGGSYFLYVYFRKFSVIGVKSNDKLVGGT